MRNYVSLCMSRLNELFVRRDTTYEQRYGNKDHLEGAKIVLRDAANKANKELNELCQSNQYYGDIKYRVKELERVSTQVTNSKKIKDVINILEGYLEEDGEKICSSICFRSLINRRKLDELLQRIEALDFCTQYHSTLEDPEYEIPNEESITKMKTSRNVNPGGMFAYPVNASGSKETFKVDGQTDSQNSCCCQWLCSY